MHNSHPKEKCNHNELQYCKDCNVVYCDICKEEWKKETSSWTWTETSGTSTIFLGDANTSDCISVVEGIKLCRHNIKN